MRSPHIGDWIGKSALYYGEREALYDVGSNRRFSFRALDERANAVAAVLQDRYHVAKGDRVGLLAHNGVECLDLFFACGKLGAIFVPFNWRLHARELAELAAATLPNVLIYGNELAEGAEAMAVTCPTLSIEDGYGALLENLDARPLPTEVDPEDIACFLFTGGTTGLPKSARLSHRMLAWNAFNTSIHEVHHGDVIVTHTPMFHTGGLFVHTLPALVMGGRVVLMRRWDPDQMIHLVADEQATLIFCVPSQYVALLQSPELAGADWHRVRFMTSGGAPLPIDVQRAFRAVHDIPFKQGFGMTEFGPSALTLSPEDAEAHLGSVGRPNYFVDAALLKDGKAVAPGEVGELCFKGPALFSGYHHERGVRPFTDAQGWFHSGDLATVDGAGYITIVGRAKDMYISGGENVYPIEVESALYSHPAVAQCAVVGMPHPKWGEVGWAHVVLKPNATLADAELLAHLSDRLARYKLPERIVLRDALPLSPAGKILKYVLREESL